MKNSVSFLVDCRELVVEDVRDEQCKLRHSRLTTFDLTGILTWS